LNLSNYSPDRENEINKKVEDSIKVKKFKPYIKEIYERILDVSRSFQKSSAIDSEHSERGKTKVGFKDLLSKRQLAFVISIFFLLLFLFYSTFFTVNAFNSDLPIEIRVLKGESFSSLANKLFDTGIIQSKTNFKIAGFLYGAEKRIKPAKYIISKPLSYLDLLDIFTNGKGDQLLTVHFKGGYSVKQLANLLNSKKITHKDSVLSLVFNKDYIVSLGLDVKSLEGYLLPDKYDFFTNISALEVLDSMYSRFTFFFNDSMKQRADELGYSIHNIITLASIVDGETNKIKEMPTIAGVYLNRLKRGMKLQADPTVQYLQPGGWKRLKFSDLKIKSPYNTYLYHGLPPGPINFPGKEAIIASLFPEEHNFLFFVADGMGGHKFSETYSEHQKKAREYYKLLNSKEKQ